MQIFFVEDSLDKKIDGAPLIYGGEKKQALGIWVGCKFPVQSTTNRVKWRRVRGIYIPGIYRLQKNKKQLNQFKLAQGNN